MIIHLNSCGTGMGDGHNKCACVQGQQFQTTFLRFCATGGTFASKGLWRDWVGGDWNLLFFFLNRTGRAKQSPAASLCQLVASSPGHMASLPAYTHWTHVVSWLIKKHFDTKGVATCPGTMFSLQTAHASVNRKRGSSQVGHFSFASCIPVNETFSFWLNNKRYWQDYCSYDLVEKCIAILTVGGMSEDSNRNSHTHAFLQLHWLQGRKK